jgi:hypothetical protein
MYLVGSVDASECTGPSRKMRAQDDKQMALTIRTTLHYAHHL